MFWFLASLIFYTALSFGGVLPYSSLAVSVAWVVGLAAFAILHLKDGRAFLFVTTALAILIALPVNTAVGLVGLPWAWYSARTSKHRTLTLFHLLLALGLIEAALGIFQYFVSPGWIFGFLTQSVGATGSLINRNHYAGLLEMLIPVAFGLAFASARQHEGIARSYLYLLSAALMGFALFISGSRMGIFCFLITIIILTILLRVRAAQRRVATAVSLAVIAVFLMGALWIGIGVIWQRYATLLDAEGALEDGRLIVYLDTVRMIADNPWGTGFNTYEDIFRRYQTYSPALLFDHAHNDYLEMGAEWGIIPAATFWMFIILTLFRAGRAFINSHSSETRGILLACIGSMLSIILHSLVDFNLQIPSNALLFFSFVGIALATSSNRSDSAELIR